jgi:hypothetical protein
MLVLIGLLALVGLGMVTFVILRSRDLKLRPVSAVRALLGLLWVIPVVAAAGYVVLRSLPHFSPDVADARPYDETRTLYVSGVRLTDSGGEQTAAVSLGGPIEIKSKPWPTPEEAVRDARAQGVRLLDAAFRPDYPYKLAWQAPRQILEKAVAGQSVEQTEHRTETATFQMHVAHLTLDLSPAVRNAYAEAWQVRISQVRMIVFSGLVALAVVIVTAAAAYFRLDLATQGAYRRRLKVAAVSLIVAGALALSQVHPFKSGSESPPPVPGDRVVQTID